MSIDKHKVDQILESIPSLYRGPGGALAVLKDGELITQYTYGYANLDKRIPITSDILLPICSITKQLTCALLIDLEENPTAEITRNGDFQEQLSSSLRALLPHPTIQNSGLTVQHLCDMQSGLRDYWATAMLCGAKAEDPFTLESDAKRMREKVSSLHFSPGTEFSYCNLNFHLLARIIEAITKEKFRDLLAQRVLHPAGMPTARLCANSAEYPPPSVGYEGKEQPGFIPVVNRIEWDGDAGVVASLDDMIAYEKYFDKRWSVSPGRYRELASPTTFKDGHFAGYRYGLGHYKIGDTSVIGHSGALRGYRLSRAYAPSERLSVIVLFNHEASASEASQHILKKLLDIPEPSTNDVEPAKEWFGNFFDEGTKMAVHISPCHKGAVSILYTGAPDTLRLVDTKHAESAEFVASIDGDSLQVQALHDNRILKAKRLVNDASHSKKSGLQGVYYCAELESTFHCEGRDGALYGAFDGILGQGPATLMRYVAGDVWKLQCSRSLDAPSPGDWTIAANRNETGAISGFTIGCWLARGLEYVRT
jgi:CubicO group peptidase (beta-lactamase class C family)